MVKEADCVAVFHSVHRVLKAEKVLKEADIAFALIPAPRQLSTDCGLALCFAPSERAKISEILEISGIVIAEIWVMEAGKYRQVV